MKAVVRFLQFAIVLAIALAPLGLHLGVVAPILVTAGLRGMAVVSLVGAVVWFALWLHALPATRPPVLSCSACGGKCPTPDACQLPIARATRPPRLAFWLAAVVPWLAHPVLKTRLALAHWNLACVVDERLNYAGIDCIGPMYLRNSFGQQRQLMTQIRELEARL